MNFEDALECFKLCMRDKFVAKDAKHGERSVLRLPAIELDAQSLWEHWLAEVEEFRANPNDYTEAVDVANMSFLLWWRSQEETLVGCTCSNKGCEESAYVRCNACRETFCEEDWIDHLETTVVYG